jgi:predicted nuclease of restriction endonuclease-like RecB superfamily
MLREVSRIMSVPSSAPPAHRIAELSPGKYCLHLDGPASVLRQTRRYGVALAKFLPALVSCKDWRMRADVTTRRGFRLQLQLSSRDGLRSHLPPPGDFDSKIESSFAEKWGDEPREGWTMRREGAVLHDGQHVFVPDFHFIHETGVEVSLEIVGFWTQEYLAKKAETIQRFGGHRVLLAVAQSTIEELQKQDELQRQNSSQSSSQSSSGQDPSGIPEDTIIYKSVLKLKDVEAALAKRLP